MDIQVQQEFPYYYKTLPGPTTLQNYQETDFFGVLEGPVQLVYPGTDCDHRTLALSSSSSSSSSLSSNDFAAPLFYVQVNP